MKSKISLSDLSIEQLKNQKKKSFIVITIFALIFILIVSLGQVFSKNWIYKKAVTYAETDDNYIIEVVYNVYGTSERLWADYDSFVSENVEKAKENNDIVIVKINDLSALTKKIVNKGDYIFINDPDLFDYNIAIYYAKNVTAFGNSVTPPTALSIAYNVRTITYFSLIAVSGALLIVFVLLNLNRLSKISKEIKNK